MSVALKFAVLARQWAAHCRRVALSSHMADSLACPAYRQLVELGLPAAPLIMERYRTEDLPWCYVLQEITGVRMIEDPDAFSPAEVRRRWLAWWREQGPGQP
jgi:hypothetical protein